MLLLHLMMMMMMTTTTMMMTKIGEKEIVGVNMMSVMIP